MITRLTKLAEALSFVQKEISPNMALPQLLIFLEVCIRDGITQYEVGQRLSMLQGTTSRNVRQLSKYLDSDPQTSEMKGYDLVEVRRDLAKRSRQALFLTTKGKWLRAELANIMGGLRAV